MSEMDIEQTTFTGGAVGGTLERRVNGIKESGVSNMHKILAVDDDDMILEIVRRTLSKNGYEVACAAEADAARTALGTFEPDLLLLDIMLPGMSGKDFLQELRKTHDTPVIFLSGLDSDFERVVGLEIGADDYITKPFLPAELTARVRAVLRRTATHEQVSEAVDQSQLEYLQIFLNDEQRRVTSNLAEISLTKIEFDLLKTLMRRPSKVYTRDQLRVAVWGPHVYVSDKTINSHVRRLRFQFTDFDGFDPVRSVRGVGYRMAKPGEAANNED